MQICTLTAALPALSASSPLRHDVHVVPTQRGWAVSVEGASFYQSLSTTQAEAIGLGITQAREGSVSLIVHGTDGRFNKVWNYR